MQLQSAQTGFVQVENPGSRSGILVHQSSHTFTCRRRAWQNISTPP